MPYRPIDPYRRSDMNRKAPTRRRLRVSLGQPMGPSQPERFTVERRKKSSSLARVLFIIVILHVLIAGGTFLNYKLNDQKEPLTDASQTPPPGGSSPKVVESSNQNATPPSGGNTLSTPMATGTTTTAAAAASTSLATTTPSQGIGKLPTPKPPVQENMDISVAPAHITSPPAPVATQESGIKIGQTSNSSDLSSPNEITAVEADEITAIDAEASPVTNANTNTNATNVSTASQAELPARYLLLSGDSWYGVAKKFNITEEQLKAANPKEAKDGIIYAGNYLKLPGGKEESAPAASGTSSAQGATYTIKSGDTLAAIARKHKMSTEKLMKINGLTDKDARRIRPGQVLKLEE